MAQRNNQRTNNASNIAEKIFNGLNTLSKEDLTSGLSKMEGTGTYVYMGARSTVIDNRGVGLACFASEDGSKLYATGGSKFAIQALGAVGRDEQMAALKDAANIGTRWSITVTGSDRNKTHTFTKL